MTVKDTFMFRSNRKYISSLLRSHFGGLQADEIVTASRVFPLHLRPDLQQAIDSVMAPNAAAIQCVGIHVRYGHETIQFPMLWDTDRHAPLIAPLQFIEIDVGEDIPIQCLQNGLWLTVADETPHAVILSEAKEYGQTSGMRIEIAVPAGTEGEALTRRYFTKLERQIREAKSYRGKVLSLEKTYEFGTAPGKIKVHRLRNTDRDEVILPQKTLDLLDRNVFNFFAQRDGLAALDFSVKKGLLFYGPPGTGKTHSIHYLASQLKQHTTLLVTAEQIGLLPEYMALARLLQPSIVVIEDADLIARNRNNAGGACEEVLLNQLLNEMDGLKPDAAVLFILTTNRPGTLEPALASRPGRIDQAIEFPLPDPECRRRLARLYSRGIKTPESVLDTIVNRTDRASGALIKELMRRATQFALEASRNDTLEQADIDSALQELVIDGGRLNATLLGAAPIESNS